MQCFATKSCSFQQECEWYAQRHIFLEWKEHTGCILRDVIVAQLVIFSDLPNADEAESLSRVSAWRLRSAYLQEENRRWWRRRRRRHGTAAAAVGGTRVISRRPDLKKAESNVAQVHKKKEKEEKITRRTFWGNLKISLWCRTFNGFA